MVGYADRTDSSMNDNELRAVRFLIDALRTIVCPHLPDGEMFHMAFDAGYYNWFILGVGEQTEWHRYDGGDAE